MKTIKTSLLYILPLFFINTASYANHRAIIEDAWIADAPPIAKIRAAYLKISNPGKHTISIHGFSSNDFSRIELHKTVQDKDMIRMEEIKTLRIKAGESIQFKPGSYHLMLFNPKRKLKVGDKITINLTLEDQMSTTFTAVVRERGKSKRMKMKCAAGKCGGN